MCLDTFFFYPIACHKVRIEDYLFLKIQLVNSAMSLLTPCLSSQMQPSAGQGAVNAMQDAIILANCIYDIEGLSVENISAALQDYREQRYPHALFQTENSKTLGKLMYGQVKSLSFQNFGSLSDLLVSWSLVFLN